MANEYLRRTPTSTGNRKVFTWAGWIKRAKPGQRDWIFNTRNQAGTGDFFAFDFLDSGDNDVLRINDSANADDTNLKTTPSRRDPSSWMHLVLSIDTTKGIEQDRVNIYANGVQISDFTLSNYPTQNALMMVNSLNGMNIGTAIDGSGNPIHTFDGEMFDLFFIDGQALTPDVFGFYKVGKGYISAGSAQATDFRPGQWVPKTPRVIKTTINNNGGFGVNGFYLPMNDSKNFGADFHCDPNSIITLNEKLPQPRVGVATTASVGLGYTDALRTDPYAANLVLALPFVSFGLATDGTSSGTNRGFGDYSHIIRGSGSAKVPLSVTNPSIAATASYYGNAAFFNGSTSELSYTANISDFNFTSSDFTVEAWCFPTNLSSAQDRNIFALYNTGSNRRSYRFGFTSFTTQSVLSDNGTNTSEVTGPAAICTNNQWYHVAYVKKGQLLTHYLNGVAVRIKNNEYASLYSNTQDSPQISLSGAYGGYIQDLRIYKGVAKYTGGFDVPKPYTPVGIATWRAVPDCTANNFATWNALQSSIPLTDGNLTCTASGSNQETYSTVGITTGKWYVEARTNVGTHNHFGVRANSLATYGTDYRLIARDDGNVYGDTSEGLIGTLSDNYATAGDIVAMAIDGNLGQITYYVNGVNVGGPYSIYQYNSSSLPTPYKIYNLANSGDGLTVNFGQNPTFSGNTTAGTFTDSNSKGLFKYQPPSGFLALCEDNLPTPAIANPGRHFKTVLYTGDGTSSRSIVGVGFTPDLVWIKNRTTVSQHTITDSVRGVDRQLFSTLTNIEQTSTTGIMSLNADGFSLGTNVGPTGDTNSSVGTYVAWCWKAGGAAVSNTDGSITSTVSANPTAGFSVVTWTGNGVDSSTVGHSLGVKPSMVIAKSRSVSGDWRVWHQNLSGAGYYLTLNQTAAQGNSTSVWGTSPNQNSTTFTIGTNSDVNTNGATYVAYCFADVEGYSKFGSYTGNGSADGPFVYTGGRPAFVMIKRTDSTNDWYIHNTSTNPTNPSQLTLLANTSDIEGSLYNHIDILSNGFKCRKSDAGTNASGGTYIFACWMESPFQTANSK